MPRPKFVRRGVYDKQLEELVQTSSWKQALTLCEKRIKKGDISDESLVRRCFSLHEQSLGFRFPDNTPGGKGSCIAFMA